MNLQKRDTSTVRLLPPLQLKRATPKGELTGYASTFGGPPDSYGDVIQNGAFARTLKEHAEADTLPAMLWAHDTSVPIGRWDEIREDCTGLHVAGSLNLDTQAGREAAAHIKHGDVGGLSIGFRIYENGVKFEHGLALLTALQLVEISVVTIPANTRARAEVKSFGSRAELVGALREIGLPKAAAKRVAAGGFSALTDDGADPDEIENIKAALRRSTERWS